MNTNRLFLVRHGENHANITKEFSCRKVDYPLTPKGVLQAHQTATYFRDKDVHEVYASPLRRAYQTAQVIGDDLRLPVHVMENFREVDVGDMEDLPPTVENWREYMRIVGEWYSGKPHVAFPGGEDYHALHRRMHEGVEAVVRGKHGRNIVVVGHGGIFIATISDLCHNVSREDLLRIEFHNCAVTEITVHERGGVLQGELVSWGYCEHLTGEAADLVAAIPDGTLPA